MRRQVSLPGGDSKDLFLTAHVNLDLDDENLDVDANNYGKGSSTGGVGVSFRHGRMKHANIEYVSIRRHLEDLANPPVFTL